MESVIKYKDTKLRVTFNSYPPHRGKRDSLGVPEEPDEPGGIEIEKVELSETADITEFLQPEDFDKIEELLKEETR